LVLALSIAGQNQVAQLKAKEEKKAQKVHWSRRRRLPLIYDMARV
jgi:hypothetical protein